MLGRPVGNRGREIVAKMRAEGSRQGRFVKGMVAIAVMSLALVAVSQAPAGAAVTKTVTGNCAGADAASAGYLGRGRWQWRPCRSTSPMTDRRPGSWPGGCTVSFTWGLALPNSLVATAKGSAGITSVGVSNVVSRHRGLRPDLVDRGPSAGRPAPFTLALTRPAHPDRSDRSARLSGASAAAASSGSSPRRSRSLSMAPTSRARRSPINISCTPGSPIVNVPIKVPGAPDITQPIAINAAAGQTLDVDVFGQYVKPGVDKTGTSQPSSPSRSRSSTDRARSSGRQARNHCRCRRDDAIRHVRGLCRRHGDESRNLREFRA